MSIPLSDDAKRALIEQRLQAFAIDSFGHEMNKQIAIDNDDTEAVTAADEAIATIAAATAAYQAELDVLTPISNNELPA